MDFLRECLRANGASLRETVLYPPKNHQLRGRIVDAFRIGLQGQNTPPPSENTPECALNHFGCHSVLSKRDTEGNITDIWDPCYAKRVGPFDRALHAYTALAVLSWIADHGKTTQQEDPRDVHPDWDLRE